MEDDKVGYNNCDQIPLVTLDSISPERRAYFDRMYVQAKLDGTIKSDTGSIFSRKFIYPDPVPIDEKFLMNRKAHLESDKAGYDNCDQIPLVTLDSISPERRAYFERMYVQAKLDGTIKSDTGSIFHRKFIYPDPVPIDRK